MPSLRKLTLAAMGTAAFCGAIYLALPPFPKLDQQPNETAQHFAERYAYTQADHMLYQPKYMFQRWRGVNRMHKLAGSTNNVALKAQIYTNLFEFYRFNGLRRSDWALRSWHEPLPRNEVEKAADAALNLAKVAPEKAVELLAEFIIYPVTVPAFPESAVNIVRSAAENGNKQAIKAMETYCTDDRFWHPCSVQERTKWQNIGERQQ